MACATRGGAAVVEGADTQPVMYLRQILPLFFLPVGITLLLVLVGLRFRRRALVWTGVGVLWLSSTPLVSVLAIRTAEGWSARAPATDVPHADAIVVLSEGRVTAPGKAAISEWRVADRFYGGIELFREGKAPLIVFTGGWLSKERGETLEGDILAAYGMALGVPFDRMATTGRVTNTEEEASAVVLLLRARSSSPEEGTSRVLLVTSAYHMARARRQFERAGLEVIPFPVDFQVSSGVRTGVLSLLPSAAALRTTEMACREMYGLLFYAMVR